MATEKKSGFTLKIVMRAMALLCMVFTFCPSFLVSCSGEDMKVSVMTAVSGVEAYGESVVDPHPVMLICLIIPVVILALLFAKKFNDKKTATLILGCTAIDLVVWFLFRTTVKKMAEENYCTFETTPWFVINIIVLLLLLGATVLIIAGKIQMDADLLSAARTSNVETPTGGAATAAFENRTRDENVIGYCKKCGKPITYGYKFCKSCGTPTSESMLVAAETAEKATEEQ